MFSLVQFEVPLPLPQADPVEVSSPLENVAHPSDVPISHNLSAVRLEVVALDTVSKLPISSNLKRGDELRRSVVLPYRICCVGKVVVPVPPAGTVA